MLLTSRADMTSEKRSQGAERGALYVEAAIVIPVFFLFLFGIIQWGLILAANITLWNAASAAARRAVVIRQGAALESTIEKPAVEAFACQQLEPFLSQANCSATYSFNTFVVTGIPNTISHQVAITYNFPLILSFVVPGSSGGAIVLSATANMY